ncbi:MAG: NAD(P)-dependent oxidoreductase, partial [archaeon]
DYLVLACPLNEETRGMIGRWEFRMMKNDAVLINIARGGVVDQDALVRALQQHSIGGAALDVFETEPLPQDSPLWDLSNVIVTPHMAGSTPEYMARGAEIFVENYERYLAGDPLKNRIV